MSETNLERNNYDPIFIAPQGRGRPVEQIDIPFYIGNFMPGVDTYFDQMTSNEGSHFALNNDCLQGRTLDKRSGTVRVGADGGAGKVLMVGALQQMNGDDVMLRIVTTATPGVKLQKYTTAGGWADIGSEWGDINSQVNFFGTFIVIDGEERFYFTNGVDILRYTEGTTISTVSDGGYDMKANFITSVENVLVIGAITDTFSRNQIVWSKAGTHQFRKDVDTDYSESSNLITLDGEITQVVTLGWLVYIFTAADGLWELDLTTGIPRAISTHGTLSPKSVSIGHNTMIWADQFGVWGLILGGTIEKLSLPLSNIYTQIDADNIPEMNGHITVDGKYVLWVGDLSYEGNSYTDVAFVYDIEKSRDSNSRVWRVWDSYPSFNWTNWTNESNFTNSYFGRSDEENVYLYGSGLTDDGSGIELIYQSKDTPQTDEKHKALVKDIYFKVKPDSAQDITLNVFLRTDMGSWQDLGDMVITADATKDMAIYRLQAGPGITGRTLAIKLVVDNSYAFKLYEIYGTLNITPDEIRPTSG